MHKTQLSHHQEQEKYYGKTCFEKILQVVQRAHHTQRDETLI
jgi:hypothetical protein